MNHSTQSSQHQRPWVHHGHPCRDTLLGVETPPASQTDWNPASADARGAQRALSGDPSAFKSEFGLEHVARHSFGSEGFIHSYPGLPAIKTDRVGG